MKTLGEKLYNYLCSRWGGAKKDKRKFVEALREYLLQEAEVSLEELTAFFEKYYEIDDPVVKMEVEVELLPIRLYHLAGYRDIAAPIAEGELEEVHQRWERAFCAVVGGGEIPGRGEVPDNCQAPDTTSARCGARQLTGTGSGAAGAGRLGELTEEEQEAFCCLFVPEHFAQGEREAGMRRFAEMFPKVEALHFSILMKRRELGLDAALAEEALEKLGNYQDETMLLGMRREIALELKDKEAMARAVELYHEHFAGHRTVANWAADAHTLFYYYALYSGWTKAPTLEPEKCIRLAGELFRDLPVPVSMALPELVAHRPRMKWTDEHCLIMVQLFFHAFCLPDGARVLEQYWWLAELCRWIEECVEDGAAFSDEIQDALAETLVIASFRLPDAKSRRLMKRAVSLLKEGHYFDAYTQGKELRALLEENIDIAAVAEDTRFSAEFRKAVHSIRDNGDAQVVIFRELDKSEALHQILRREYPALCADYDALIRQANEAADAAFSQAAPEDDIFATLQQEPRPQPVIRAHRKIGRNEPCPCGSGKKFKNCCMGKGIYD